MFRYVAPVALLALLTTSCTSPPREPDRRAPGSEHVIDELEAHVRASGPANAPPPSLIDARTDARRLPPPPRYTAPQPAGAPATDAPAAAPHGAPGSARSYIERYPQQR